MKNPTTPLRPIHAVNRDIRREWKNVNYAAKPYLDVMDSLSVKTDMFYADDAISIVLYFLCNATSFRGNIAKTLKAELKAIVK
jgi:hypothetical protein